LAELKASLALEAAEWTMAFKPPSNPAAASDPDAAAALPLLSLGAGADAAAGFCAWGVGGEEEEEEEEKMPNSEGALPSAGASPALLAGAAAAAGLPGALPLMEKGALLLLAAPEALSSEGAAAGAKMPPHGAPATEGFFSPAAGVLLGVPLPNSPPRREGGAEPAGVGFCGASFFPSFFSFCLSWAAFGAKRPPRNAEGEAALPDVLLGAPLFLSSSFFLASASFGFPFSASFFWSMDARFNSSLMVSRPMKPLRTTRS